MGFMGSGKSAVGRRLARLLALPFVDLDEEIRREAGISIPSIFGRESEKGFRVREAKVLRGVLALPGPRIIAAGGGILERAENRRVLARRDVILIWLDASFATCLARAKASRTRRPLLKQSTAAVRRLYRDRRRFYAEARIRIRSERASVAAVAKRVADFLRTNQVQSVSNRVRRGARLGAALEVPGSEVAPSRLPVLRLSPGTPIPDLPSGGGGVCATSSSRIFTPISRP